MRDGASRACHSCGEKWEKSANFFRARLPPILGDLESLKVLGMSRLRAVALFKLLTPFRSGVSGCHGPYGQPFFPLDGILWDLIENPNSPRKPFVELRNVRVQHVDLLVENVVDG